MSSKLTGTGRNVYRQRRIPSKRDKFRDKEKFGRETRLFIQTCPYVVVKPGRETRNEMLLSRNSPWPRLINNTRKKAGGRQYSPTMEKKNDRARNGRENCLYFPLIANNSMKLLVDT